MNFKSAPIITFVPIRNKQKHTTNKHKIETFCENKQEFKAIA